MYQTALFDLDGTLTDPGEGITNSVAFALERFGISVADHTTLYKFIGPPLRESFQVFYGFDAQKAGLAVDYYREYYRDRGIFENLVIDGIPALLAQLKNAGVRCAVATSKPEEFAKRILEHYALDGYFDLVAGSCMDNSRTDKGEVIAYALQQLPPNGATVMVGDREHDVLGAAKNGLPCIGVLFGYGSARELTQAGACALAEDAPALGRLLLA